MTVNIQFMSKITQLIKAVKIKSISTDREKALHPFWVMVYKEVSDHISSWRFIILALLMALTCIGSLYASLTNLSEAVKPDDPHGTFLFLKLFTVSDGSLPPFH